MIQGESQHHQDTAQGSVKRESSGLLNAVKESQPIKLQTKNMFKTHKKLMSQPTATIRIERTDSGQKVFVPSLPSSGSSFNTPVQLKYASKVPSEDKPAVPNKRNSKGHFDKDKVNTMASSQSRFSFKEAGLGI